MEDRPKLVDYKCPKPNYGIPQTMSQISRQVKAGRFPPPLKMGSRNCWLESEIISHIRAQAAARNASK